MLLCLVAGVTAVSRGTSADGYQTGSFKIESPVYGSVAVTSAPRFHDGCPPDTYDYSDSPRFDQPYSQGGCRAAAGGDWAMDLGAAAGTFLYIGVAPAAVDGNSAGGEYQVVTGNYGYWYSNVCSCACYCSGDNNEYQYFWIQVPSYFGFINAEYVVLGHIVPEWQPGVVVIPPTTSASLQLVAEVHPAGTWDAHNHVEPENSTNWSRDYNWDGPSNAVKGNYYTPQCSRSGSSATNCSAWIQAGDYLGYVGGSKTSWSQIDNPYFPSF
jgi:hypothetical protein